MNKVFENEAITIERTPGFFQAARQLSDYIKDLPLDQPTNDQLVALMIDQVNQAEKGAFAHGFRVGVEFAGCEAVHEKDVQQGSSLLS